MVGHGGSSAGSYLADPTSPIPSHCTSIVVTSTVRVNSIDRLHNWPQKEKLYGAHLKLAHRVLQHKIITIKVLSFFAKYQSFMTPVVYQKHKSDAYYKWNILYKDEYSISSFTLEDVGLISWVFFVVVLVLVLVFKSARIQEQNAPEALMNVFEWHFLVLDSTQFLHTAYLTTNLIQLSFMHTTAWSQFCTTYEAVERYY